MTLQQLEKRLAKLENKFLELENHIRRESAKKCWRKTFGMFADDPEFDEILRLGREYREQENQQSP